MSISEYKKKRNFEDTNEPEISGQIDEKGNKLNNEFIFVIQKHNASRLHYDLRLEIDGVLKSWAVPKVPPIEEGVKRLAVQTEDHPIEYAEFEGIIPEGNYGAGKVEIWDNGVFIPEKVEDDEITFKLAGRKLNGKFAIIRLKKSKNWLFFKRKT